MKLSKLSLLMRALLPLLTVLCATAFGAGGSAGPNSAGADAAYELNAGAGTVSAAATLGTSAPQPANESAKGKPGRHGNLDRWPSQFGRIQIGEAGKEET